MGRGGHVAVSLAGVDHSWIILIEETIMMRLLKEFTLVLI